MVNLPIILFKRLTRQSQTYLQFRHILYLNLFNLPADVGEVKRVTNTDTFLHALHKYTNYSVQVLAFTNAGDGKRSPPVYCMTEEDGNYEPS